MKRRGDPAKTAKPMAPATVFCCGGKRRTCEFSLKGRKLGQVCGANTGPGDPIIIDGCALCPAHARLLGVKGA